MMPETYSITLKHDNGIDYLAPRTIASNVTMADGRTTEVAISEKADKITMPNDWKTVLDLPISYPKGNTIFYGNTLDWNTIGNGFGCLINTISHGDGYFAIQYISNYSDSKAIKYRVVNTYNGWGEWQTIATSADLENKADKIYKGNLPVTNILDIPFNINIVRYLINANIPANAPINGTAWSTIETKPLSSGRYLELYWFNWGGTPAGNMFGAILDTQNKTFVTNWQETATIETGTWTPTIRGNTGVGNNIYVAQIGNYVKIGKIVVLSFRTALSEKDVAMTGVTLIGGLPFLPKDKGGANHNYGQITLRSITLNSDERLCIVARSNILEIMNQTNAVLTNLNVNRLNNNTEIAGSITYEID